MKVTVKAFSELTNMELFKIYKLRTDVFVVEQNCAYPEVDEADLVSKHLQMHDDTGNLVGYLRLIPETDHTAIRIGRVVIDPNFRKHGYGRQLLTAGIQVVQAEMPKITTIKIQAQAYLQQFYESFEFEATSDVYLDTGIPHLDMIRKL
ncbi:GNAT family N-acetyltransferase [Pediococcus parvulus]|jgi:ElaA protein|uniref:GNAT family N-acetyltransferase n=1 Tax=Pediococcus parvulus TaxID=54062 RepID=UPI0021A2C9B5|nr:GNAT family N-acetyltransferase [Pediococcus parvulus]MCT3035709.1 GNAT family N-acetyltransferase [Pediococcus parvulus]